MALFISMPGLVLLESFFGCFARHPHIETLKYTIKLGIGSPETGVFCEYTFGEFNNVDGILGQ